MAEAVKHQRDGECILAGHCDCLRAAVPCCHCGGVPRQRPIQTKLSPFWVLGMLGAMPLLFIGLELDPALAGWKQWALRIGVSLMALHLMFSFNKRMKA